MDTGAPEESASSGKRPGLYAWYVATILMLTYALSLLDRKLPSILVEPIKRELGFSDLQIGLITGVAFALVYSIAAIPIASFADRGSRKHLIAGAVLVWSLLTAIGGLAQNFWQLALSRVGVAAGEAVCSPASHSIIADYFSPRFRGRALALYFMGAQVGALLALTLGGWINDMANWRVAMMILGAPGLVLGLLLLLTVKEPARPAPVEGEADRPAMLDVVRALMRQRIFVHMLVAAILFMFSTGAVEAFTPAYIIRTYHLTAAQTGFSYGLAVGLAGIIGTLSGGHFGDRLKATAPWRAMMLVAAAFAVTTPTLVLAYATPSYPLCLAMIFVSQVGITIYAGPSFSILQTLVPPRMHAVASALYLFALSGIGLSLGPLFVGALSDLFKSWGYANSLRWALMMAAIPKAWCAAHFWLAAQAIRERDQRSISAS